MFSTHSPRRLFTVHWAHRIVEHNRIDRMRSQKTQRFGAGVSSENRISKRLKNNAVTGQDRRLIINKKNRLSEHLVLRGGATAVACTMCLAPREVKDEDWRSRTRLWYPDRLIKPWAT